MRPSPPSETIEKGKGHGGEAQVQRVWVYDVRVSVREDSDGQEESTDASCRIHRRSRGQGGPQSSSGCQSRGAGQEGVEGNRQTSRRAEAATGQNDAAAEESAQLVAHRRRAKARPYTSCSVGRSLRYTSATQTRVRRVESRTKPALSNTEDIRCGEWTKVRKALPFMFRIQFSNEVIQRTYQRSRG